ncbi:MAG: Holliday junction branch migration protein RuvA [Spirulina sp. DLM2.Bin59]|nr:MAG: Holliday junction branch migration protein RuvA [Spirulina sp. DLM2.Bin59]
MISYLKGAPVAIVRRPPRTVLILEVQGIGYEVQIPPRWLPNLGEGERLQLFTHQQIREDQTLLYGFPTAPERDLFRQLIAVTGIGAQLAIALLNTLGLELLVEAIISENTKALIQTPGVGKKTAERIILELKTQLGQWRKAADIPLPSSSGLDPTIQEDVELTLLALGYEGTEILAALTHLRQDPRLETNPTPEDWIKGAIAWLSQA